MRSSNRLFGANAPQHDGSAIGGRSPRLLAVVASSLMFVVSGRSVGAQADPPPAPAVIHACYVPLTGTLYRIKEVGLHSACTSSNNTEFAWTDGLGALRATDAASGDLGGLFSLPKVVGLQGIGVSSTAPTTGQVLTFDGTRWAGAAPLAFNGIVNGPFVATGRFGVGGIPVSGLGVRMMWVPGKVAFRVGQVSSDQWNDDHLGAYSIAMGTDDLASGAGAIALGDSPTASGGYSVAIGSNATATGDFAFAVGSRATASGAFAMALGHNATAAGDNSFAASLQSVASGAYSIALGRSVTAAADYSVAIGVNTIADGTGALATGNATHASGTYSTAIGNVTTASGDLSTAMGSHASTDGHAGSFVYGDNSTGTIVKALKDDEFVVRAQHFWFGRAATEPPSVTDALIETSTGAYLSAGGTWVNVSDVNKKHAFGGVSGEDVLSRIAALPIRTWSYNGEASTVRHMGPTAQDFFAAFHLGYGDTSIGTVDADGVNLAAIQALEARTRSLAAENAELKARLEALERGAPARGAPR